MLNSRLSSRIQMKVSAATRYALQNSVHTDSGSSGSGGVRFFDGNQEVQIPASASRTISGTSGYAEESNGSSGLGGESHFGTSGDTRSATPRSPRQTRQKAGGKECTIWQRGNVHVDS